MENSAALENSVAGLDIAVGTSALESWRCCSVVEDMTVVRKVVDAPESTADPGS